MGLEVTKAQFEPHEFERFEEKLQQDLIALHRTLGRPGFGLGPRSIGAELELNLVGEDGTPILSNGSVRERAQDPRLTLEVNRFNLEINSSPVLLAGTSLTRLHGEISEVLSLTRRAAAHEGARVAVIGILPTLTEAHLGASVLSEGLRYRALSAGISRLRRQPFQFRIQGEDELITQADDVTFEGANTSFQVHLRTAPSEFADMYNAAQLATAVVLACAGNSPLFLGRRLWQETRIALFRQSVDDRVEAGPDDWRPARVSFGHGWVRQGLAELFEQSVAMHPPLLPVLGLEDPIGVEQAGGVPTLAELRLHHGTVWRWNRAVYDAAGGGHLRIELRALPAGPTAADMVANAAFLVGLTLGLAPRMAKYCNQVTFGHARHNFYAAAQHGLDAELLWPAQSAPSPQPMAAAPLALSLIALAHSALVAEGVSAEEASRWLGIVEARLARRQTGARWQSDNFRRRAQGQPSAQAMRAMLGQYLELSESDEPVHTWPS